MKKDLSFLEKLKKIKNAGLQGTPEIKRKQELVKLEPLEERVKILLGIAEKCVSKNENMLYFVMYDIENDKVRTQISKYLIKKGCTRVQKSIFLANTHRNVFDEIKTDLHEVQSCYENNDSIMMVPISTDEVKAMKVIGKNVDFDLILQNKNTLFF